MPLSCSDKPFQPFPPSQAATSPQAGQASGTFILTSSDPPTLCKKEAAILLSILPPVMLSGVLRCHSLARLTVLCSPQCHRLPWGTGEAIPVMGDLGEHSSNTDKAICMAQLGQSADKWHRQGHSHDTCEDTQATRVMAHQSSGGLWDPRGCGWQTDAQLDMAFAAV